MRAAPFPSPCSRFVYTFFSPGDFILQHFLSSVIKAYCGHRTSYSYLLDVLLLSEKMKVRILFYMEKKITKHQDSLVLLFSIPTFGAKGKGARLHIR